MLAYSYIKYLNTFCSFYPIFTTFLFLIDYLVVLKKTLQKTPILRIKKEKKFRIKTNADDKSSAITIMREIVSSSIYLKKII
jgi:hypothetical protein